MRKFMHWLRERWRRLMRLREELHAEAERMGVSPDRYEVFRPPGDSD